MKRLISPRGAGLFVIALVLGTLYAIFVGMISGPVRGAYISWPVWIGIFWLAFFKFNLLRYSGFAAALPVAVLGFELTRSVANPGLNAEVVKSYDRSHFVPGFRTVYSPARDILPGDRGWGLKEVAIGEDDFASTPKPAAAIPKDAGSH